MLGNFSVVLKADKRDFLEVDKSVYEMAVGLVVMWAYCWIVAMECKTEKKLAVE